jgi:hypothetical protein
VQSHATPAQAVWSSIAAFRSQFTPGGQRGDMNPFCAKRPKTVDASASAPRPYCCPQGIRLWYCFGTFCM